MKKAFKMTGFSILIIVVLIIFSVGAFLNCSPQFGKGLSKYQKREYDKLENFKNGKFQNQHPSPMDINYWELMKKFAKSDTNRQPHKNIDVNKIDAAQLNGSKNDLPKLTWFGHSTFLLEIEGKIVFIDPMLSKSPSPISFIGTKRFSTNLPILSDELPQIDAIILSHDHYDHLDYETIKKLKDKTDRFFVPLGVENYLIEWGVPKEKITALNWGDGIQYDNLKLTCTPARHFSGRGLFDRASSLWCSWVIASEKHNIFFSGDSGYDTHFKEIGDTYGPFDISLLECGQYNEDWKYLHMMPEQTVQAGVDLNSKLILPMHWGAFTLAFHAWTDPIERALAKAKELNIPVATPRIGEKVIVGNKTYPKNEWWTHYHNGSN